MTTHHYHHHHTYFQSPTTQTNHKPWKKSKRPPPPPQSPPTPNTLHPSSVLLDLVIDMNWPQTIKRAQTDPIDATYLDEGGETPLYIACQSNPPIDVILALLRAYPSAARVPQTKRRDLPLHLACRYRASARILRALLGTWHCPGSDEDGLFSDGVSIPDKLMSSAEMAVMPCRWGRTPLTALWEGHNHALLREEEKSEEELWEKVCVILRATRPDIVRSRNKRDGNSDNHNDNAKDNVSSPHDDNDDDDGWLMLHTAASIGLKACPLPIFRLVLQRCQLNEAQVRDLNGYTALHHLITAPIANRLICDEQDHCEVFDGILDMNPSAAYLPLGDDGDHHHDDHDGTKSSNMMVGEEFVMERRRLPLHSAIAHGRSWNGGVASLLSAHPDAIRIADPVTRLFPFMLAGASSGKSGFATSLDTIFMLLVSQPDVVGHGLGVNGDGGDGWSKSREGKRHERNFSTSETCFIPFDKRGNDDTPSCVLC